MVNERRRRLLATTGAALAAGLAGCSGDDGGDGGDGGTTQATATPTATETMETTETTSGTTETTSGTTETETETATATATATPTETATATPTETTVADSDVVELTINNVGVSAWEVVRDTSGGVAPMDTENPTMTFSVGTRYEVRNNGWDFHPFALRASDDTPLVTQSGTGRYEDSDAVDWVDNGGNFAFTMTSALAEDLSYYICTIHSSMRGTATAD